MPRKTKNERIKSINDQIRELQEKKTKMEEKLYLEIGKHIVQEWDTDQEEELKEVITRISDAAIRELDKMDNNSKNENIEEDSKNSNNLSQDEVTN